MDDDSKFLTDDMVGKLTRWLRIIGLDVAAAGRVSDNDLVRRALDERRVLLTRHAKLPRAVTDPALRKRLGDLKLIILNSPNYLEQIDQVFEETGLRVDESRLFTRCLVCNSLLEPVSKEEVAGEVPEFTYALYDKYARCSRCNKVFWKGTHTERILAKLELLKHGRPT